MSTSGLYIHVYMSACPLAHACAPTQIETCTCEKNAHCNTQFLRITSRFYVEKEREP